VRPRGMHQSQRTRESGWYSHLDGAKEVSSLLVLVKHSQPVLDASVPAREWQLSQVGEGQAVQLAERLRQYLPFRLLTSIEPKAYRTCEIISEVLGLPMSQVGDLHEIDRRALPIVSSEVHEEMNAPIFTDVDKPVLGSESARDALERFRAAVHREASATVAKNLVIVSHGTVISLFSAAYNDFDAFTLWKNLECASFVVLTIPSMAVVEAPLKPEPNRS
jgi:broad specificity phosphatase PhoE